jgi:hypothetical protein
MGRSEPLPLRSSSKLPLFLIGRNSRGYWVVRDQCGLRGGLFVDRAEALRFALFENGNRPQAIIMVPGILELDIAGQITTSPSSPAQMAMREQAQSPMPVFEPAH